jgi:diguanylate cyclase (GGDEF)-like protein
MSEKSTWDELRRDNLNRLVVMFGLTVPIAAAASGLAKYMEEGCRVTMVAHVILSMFAIFVTLRRNSLTRPVKVYSMIFGCVMVGVLSLDSYEFSAVGGIFLVGGGIIAAITMGSVAAKRYALVAATIMAAFGYVNTMPGLATGKSLTIDGVMWGINALAFLAVMFGLSYVVGRMTEALKTIVEELLQKNVEILSLAERDRLTGLWNGRVVHDRLQYILDRRNRRARPTSTLYVMFMDMNGFKHINDTYTHSVGDTALVITATRLRDMLRPEDIIARLGGDEFVAIVEVDNTEHDINDLVCRMVKNCTLPFTVDGNSLQLGISIGIAVIEPTDLVVYTPTEILDMADKAMYLTKKTGGSGYTVYDNPASTQNCGAYLLR